MIRGHRSELGRPNETSGRPGLRAALVLAGGLRPSPLVEAAGRSVLDLYLTPKSSVLDILVRQLSLLPARGVEPLSIRVAHNYRVPAPWPEAQAANVRFEQDPQPYRGPAGLVADLCANYDEHEHVLVVEAGRVLICDLESMWRDHLVNGADVTVGCNEDHSPAGVYITKCSALRNISPIGFVDIKEQWLACACEQGLRVRVHQFLSPGALPLTTRADFLVAARYINNQLSSAPDRSTTFLRPDVPGWDQLRVIGHGAAVGPDVSIDNAVIMPGAVIGYGAFIEQSVICPGAVVEPKVRVVNAIVSTSGFHIDERATTISISGQSSELDTYAKAA